MGTCEQTTVCSEASVTPRTPDERSSACLPQELEEAVVMVDNDTHSNSMPVLESAEVDEGATIGQTTAVVFRDSRIMAPPDDEDGEESTTPPVASGNTGQREDIYQQLDPQDDFQPQSEVPALGTVSHDLRISRSMDHFSQTSRTQAARVAYTTRSWGRAEETMVHGVAVAHATLRHGDEEGHPNGIASVRHDNPLPLGSRPGPRSFPRTRLRLPDRADERAALAAAHSHSELASSQVTLHPQRRHQIHSLPTAELRMTRDGSGATASGSSRLHTAVFFDFDSTLSIPQFLERAQDYALADRRGLCSSMTPSEVIANFGGHARITRLMAMLRRLCRRGVAIYIISLGFVEPIRFHLTSVGLSDYFPEGRIFGQDSVELSEVWHQKGRLIQRLMKMHDLEFNRCLFVDDDDRHVNLCCELGACPAFHVRGDGLALDEIEQIEGWAEVRCGGGGRS